jgi:hypothetical protein
MAKFVSVKFRVDKPRTNLRRQQREVEKLPAEALRVFRAETPRRTGAARRNTRLVGDTIDANYAYADRLDSGWSPKAPQGMTEPTTKWLRKQIKKIFKR